jgi:hypothetical protein
MRPEIQRALSEERPFQFLWALENVYDYTAPDDFRRLSEAGKMAVALRCFSDCMASGGYREVIAELHDWLPEIKHALQQIGEQRFAEGVDAILQRAAALRLDIHDEDGVDTLEALDDYHRMATLRDIPHVPRVSELLRQFVQTHADFF